MTEREFWIVVRRVLILLIDAIEKRYCLGKHKGELLIENDN